LKGLPARAADIEIKVPPRFFAIHEFDREDLDLEMLYASASTPWSTKILSNLKEPFESNFWSLKGSFGEKKFFQ